MADESKSRKASASAPNLPPSTRSKRPPVSAYGAAQATVIVGSNDEKRTFYVDQGLLTFYSGYFKAALSGRWTTAEDDAITLVAENAKIFEHFVSWLYTRSVTDDDEPATFPLIIDLWLFADRREIPLLMNEMLDCLRDRIVSERNIPMKHMSSIYQQTAPNCALRRMLVHAIIATASDRFMADDSKKTLWPHDALWDLSRALMKISRPSVVGVGDYGKMDICSLFHTHEEGVRCSSKGLKRSSEEMDE